MNNSRAMAATKPFRNLFAPICVSGLLLWSPRGFSAEQHLSGHVPAAVRKLQPIGHLSPTTRLHLAIGLPIRDRDGLTNLLEQLYNPASPSFRHFLTPQEFAARFGPAEQDYQNLVAFVQANGLDVVGTHPNRLVLDVSGSVADIERAFHVTLRTYSHPREHRTFFAPDSDPMIDPGILILDINGLDNYKLPHPMSLVQKPATPMAVAYNGSAPGGTFWGNDFRAAYAPGVALTGTGQSVGLVEFDGYFAGDITSYENQTGLPNVLLQNVLLNHFNGKAGANNSEVALDIEMVASMAPGVSSIIVYEGILPNTVLNRMATDNQAKQLSCSWGFTINSTTENIYLQYATQGQTMTQASGDDDAYTGAISAPSDDPNLLVVGGTTLFVSGTGGPWASETTWNWYNTGIGTSGSGGGVSTTYSIPSWQQGISMASNQGSTLMRNIPDVALTADNIYVLYNNGGSGVFGGTSAAAPLWAAYIALVNQQLVAAGKPVIGFANPSIYSLAKGASYASLFHDITTGNNTNTASPTKFFAVSGYDLCTGWGTPSGQSLIDALTGVSNSPPSFAGSPFTEPTANAGFAYSSSIATQASDPDGDTLTFSKNSGPTWLVVASNGALSGTPANSNAGTNSFVVKATDPGGLFSTATMLIYVNGAPFFTSNPFAEPNVNVGQSYSASIAGKATDPNPGDTLTFAKVSGPAWLSVSGNGSLSGTPSGSDVGTNSFVVRVTDPGGLSSTATMFITVNGAPSFTSNPFSEPGANAGQSYSATLAGKATDPNPGDTLTFAKVSGPAWLAIAGNGALSGTPGNGDSGTNSFVVSVTDSGGLSNTATMRIVVNGAPSFTTNPFTEPGANAGQPYSASIAANATDPNPGDSLTFSKVSGPSWLNVAGNGTISGTAANSDAGTNSFVVKVTDSGGLSNTATMLIYVNGSPSFSSNPFAEPNVNVGQAYSASIAGKATDPNPGDTLAFAKVSGPAWLSVASNGSLSGAPANGDAGTNSFVVSVTDPGGLSNSATMFITVNGAPSFTSNPFSEPSVNAGQSYSASIAGQATDPNPGDVLTFAKVSGSAWLSVASTGALSGTPANTDAGTNSFVVSVTDSGGLSNTATMFVIVNGAPAFTANPFTEPGANAGQPYSASVAANATDPNPGDSLTFAKVSGPSWLNVTTNGTISGTAGNSDAGTNSFVVKVTDSGGLSSTATMLIYVNGAPAFTSNPFAEPNVNVGQAYSASIAGKATDPNPGDTLTFAKVSGPTWLGVSSNGSLSGAPSGADVGTNTFAVSVTDPGGLSNLATMFITVNGAPSFTSNPFSEPSVNAGQSYSASIASQATDPNPGDVPTFAKVSGSAWLSVASNGSLSGTPANTDAGTNSFIVSVTDSGGLSNTATMFLIVNGAPSFTANPFTEPGANAGQPYSASIVANATDPNPGDSLTFTKVSGPTWLNVTTNGSISGTAANSDAGTNSFVVKVTDSGGLFSTATMLIYVNGSPSFISNPFAEPNVNVGQAYSASIAGKATDPNPGDTLTFAKVSGPAWLSVATNGSLSGASASGDAGTNSFVVSVTDSGGLSNSATMFITVNGAPSFTSNPFSEPSVNAGQSYSASIAGQATDPNPGDVLTFAKVSGSAWLSVASNGALSGTPANTDAGTNSFIVSVTDSGGLSNTATMFLIVNGAPSFTSNPFTEPGANAGLPYSASITGAVTDPNPADLLTFAKAGGPAWLTVTTNGTISGTAANSDAGTNSFVVNVTDSGGLSSTATMLIYVNGAPSFTNNPFAEPNANVGQAYLASIAGQATDPNAGDTLVFAKVSGPAWLNVETNGAISGLPSLSDSGTNTFLMSVTDSGGLSNSATMFISVNAAPSFTSDPFTEPNANAGQAYSSSIAGTATDPNPGDSLSFSKVSGPAWLQLDPNGQLSGIPASANAGTNAFVVSVADQGGLSNTATMFITVNGAPAFVANPFIAALANAGQPYSDSIATKATDPNAGDVLTFAKVSGPAWLNVSSGGALSGSPTETDTGTNTFVVSVTDASNLSSTATMLLLVNGSPFFTNNPIQGLIAKAAQPFSALLATNATDPNPGDVLTFAKVDGAAWLLVDTNGLLSGTPLNSDAGTNTFHVSVTDAGGLSNTASLLIVVGGIPGFALDPFDAPPAQVGQPYSATLATNATSPNLNDSLTFGKISGPAWLTVLSSGALSGTPASADSGTNTFVVSVTNSFNLFSNATMLISVLTPHITSSITLQISLVGDQVSLNWSGGNPPFQVQTASQLASPTWSNIADPTTNNSILLPPTNGAAFYRVQGQ